MHFGWKLGGCVLFIRYIWNCRFGIVVNYIWNVLSRFFDVQSHLQIMPFNAHMPSIRSTFTHIWRGRETLMLPWFADCWEFITIFAEVYFTIQFSIQFPFCIMKLSLPQTKKFHVIFDILKNSVFNDSTFQISWIWMVLKSLMLILHCKLNTLL